jgi:hypothetical protein
MAKKKVSRKRTTKKKGMSTLTKVLIGGAVIGGGWLIYDQFFAKKEDPEKAAADAAAAAQAAIEGQAAAAALNAVDPGTGIKKPPLTSLLPEWLDPTKPKDKRTLSALGTPGTKQNWGLTLFKFDKGGEVETLQSLFNRISKAYGKQGIRVDGNFGKETEKKRIAILGGAPGVTLAQVYKLVKAVEAKGGGSMGPNMTFETNQFIPNSGIPTITPNWLTVKP